MRVAQFSEFGGPQALRLEETAEPSPGSDDILIRVTAVGLNFFDTLLLRNQYQVSPPLPFSPGAEIAGIIEGLGANCSVPMYDGTESVAIDKDGTWARFFMEAPARRRRCVERYNIVKRA